MTMAELAQSLLERRGWSMSPETIAYYRGLLTDGQDTLVVIDLLADGVGDGNLTAARIKSGAKFAAEGRLLKVSAYFAEHLPRVRAAA